ncbi:2Fe-2S iron-sulfur cluster-binding protein [Albidovulum sediminicola]|uniref:succinate dehydrogenase n=1 Tax=Albidovulum sediminicola TaxID=2984331 RepID=A0ABT2Z579_9RHOB|nr:2Fe-2S iron-sulfur cluster-binding protein [Defluviimonas sp. WL0075]MCV2866314.1 2Fe-2S iron-sulfur cluster-binding protein [Defluviimonas sp. WL0075]
MSDTLTLTVNGEVCSLTVPPRTQLAEVLRDHLDLTGTHIGCEQGVCGACTVMMNGKPVRSCITFAHACDGAVIDTIEGHVGDPVMDHLRAAFSRHHALQCGFCTPGMLATARDIVARFDVADEATIRHELSGNLCRCTGYVGIVGAIGEVIAAKGAGGFTAARPAPSRSAEPFTPFEPVEANLAEGRPAAPTGSVSSDGGWTVVKRRFTLSHGPDGVWELFRDPARVAPCIPGASIESLSPEAFTGAVEIRFGPIGARFGGQGTYDNDDDKRAGTIRGQGDDKLGKSKVRGELRYAISQGPNPQTSQAEVELRFEIDGMLAQFNRPELVAGFVDYILAQFAANCDAVLAGGEAGPARRLSLFAMLWAVLKARFSR